MATTTGDTGNHHSAGRDQEDSAGGISTPALKRSRVADSSEAFTGRCCHCRSVVTPTPPAWQNSLTPMSDKDEIQSLLLEEAAYDCSGDNVVPKRSGYLSWDDYFLAVASLSAHRSKDPFEPTGACIVDSNNRIVGIGYNGFPAGCSDDCLPWNATTTTSDGEDEMTALRTQTPFMVHSEVNAVLNKVTPDCRGARLYKKEFPCNECAKVIVQTGLSQVNYVNEPSLDNEATRASRILLQMAGVQLRRCKPSCECIELDFWKALNCTELQEAPAIAKEEQKQDSSAALKEAHKHRELLQQEAGYDPVTTPSTKRPDAMSWDDYFMAVAFLTAQRSKDPNTQVGACLVDESKRIVGLGYNGFPAGCSDDYLPWSRKADSNLHKKYHYVVHAEVNAILNKGSADLRGATLFVALFPCNDCAKMIIQAGIREVVFMSDQYHDTPGCRASRILLRMAGVKLRRHIPTKSSVRVFLKNQVKAKSVDESSEQD